MRRAFRGWVLGLLTVCAGTAHASDAPFLWEVQGAQTKHYLMGSIHVLPRTAYPLPAGLEAAYDKSEGLVLETDAGALASPDLQKRMLEAAMLPQGLKSAVAPKLYERLRRSAGELRLPLSLCESYRPWFCALSLEVFALESGGALAALGLDSHFYNRAGQDGRPVRWLESPDEQLRIFTGMSAGTAEQLLASTLDEITKPGQRPEDLIDDWRSNDVPALTASVAEMRKLYPEAYARLLSIRNHAWLPRLQAMYAEDRPQLVIVGAAHLVGPEGLPELLRAKGLELHPIEQPAAGTVQPGAVQPAKLRR